MRTAIWLFPRISIASNERPSRATLEASTGLAPPETVARDFENAIVDDDNSES